MKIDELIKMFNKWSTSWYPKEYTYLRLYPDGGWSIWVNDVVVVANCTTKDLEQYLTPRKINCYTTK